MSEEIFLGDVESPHSLRSSFRGFKVGEQFANDIKKCNKRDDPAKRNSCRSNVRAVYRNVESGRLAKMGDSIHDFISKLDSDEVEKFKKDFPQATKIANEFALVEDLREF